MQANYPPPRCSHSDMSKCLHEYVYTEERGEGGGELGGGRKREKTR
jgi:hypothetical protein